ncbi:MAG: DegT/DnrJ/EryC1/StrS family aminotransferase [Egibacteraceae bacterium]
MTRPMCKDATSAVGVPFLDLAAMHAQVAARVGASWDHIAQSTAFVGGPYVEDFEHAWAAYCDRRHAVGVGNGTDALQLALEALGIGHGDEVIVPANTFVATAAAVVAVGASPRFIDVQPETLLLSAELVEAAITARTAAVIVVHLFGQPADMDAIGRVAQRAGLAVVEDAAQAHGATWRDRKAGSLGDVGCFSFYPGKNLGAYGDAGAVVTDDPVIAERVRSLANHGRSPTSKYVHDLVGVNSRLDAVHAAVLSAKLPHLNAWNAARRRVAASYRVGLASAAVRPVAVAEGACSAFHLFVVRTHDRDELRAALASRHIATDVHYPIPCHKQTGLERFADGPLPVAEQAAAEILSLPIFPHMTAAQVGAVCAAVTDASTKDAGTRSHAG